MKNLPACQTCINSGFLCNSCQTKLDEGHLTEFELDLARDLLELELSDGRFDYLKNVSFYKAIDFEDVVILVIGKNDKIRFSEELLDWIKSSYEIDKIILMEKSSKPRPVIESLITPYKLLSLNEIFLATGDIEFKGIIRKADQDKILFTKEEIEELVMELTNKVIRIEFA